MGQAAAVQQLWKTPLPFAAALTQTLLPPGGNWHTQELEGASHLSTFPGPRGLGCPLRDVPSAEPFLIPRGDNFLGWELRRPPWASRWGWGGSPVGSPSLPSR